MHLVFLYEGEKEFLNLQAGNRSLNRSHQSDFSKQLEDSGVDINSPESVTEKCREIISKKGLDVAGKIQFFTKKWEGVEQEAFERLGRLFETDKDPTEITAYLSLNERCSYNSQEGYFFINIFSQEPIMVCLHEILHFFTHKFIKLDISPQHYNNYKESLTVLLNLEFADLTEHEDRGYPQHKKIRDYITKKYDGSSSVASLTKVLFADDTFLKLLSA